MEKIKCLKCNSEFIKRVEKPVRCPRCFKKLDKTKVILDKPKANI